MTATNEFGQGGANEKVREIWLLSDGAPQDGVLFCGYRQSEGQKLGERKDYRLPITAPPGPFFAINIAIRSSSKPPVGIHHPHHL
jgi:hypothetical protein